MRVSMKSGNVGLCIRYLNSFELVGYGLLLMTGFSQICTIIAESAQNESPDVSSTVKSLPDGHLKKLGEHGNPLIGQLTEIDYMIGGKDFYTHFVRKRVPLIMRGVAVHWNAVKFWHNESYLQEQYGNVLMDVEMGKIYEGKLNVRKTMNMNEFLSLYKNTSIYLDSPFPQSEMIKDLETPMCMQCHELSNTIASAHLLFSSGNTSSSFHHDGYDNLLTVISGVKVVLVFNYSYGKELYADEVQTFPGLSPINPERVDFKRYPLFADVPFHKVILHPGDLLYIPKHWWHHVRSYDSPNIGVSIWFHPFKPNNTDDEDVNEIPGAREVIRQENEYAKLVDSFPETIECSSQNKPITELIKSLESTWEEPQEEGMQVKTILLKNGYKVPMIGFGTAGLFDKTEELVSIALKEGYRLIDTAQAYDNEAAIGKAIKNSGIPREEIFIASKIHPKNLGYESSSKSAEESLNQLGFDYIDLMLIHSKDCDEGPDALLRCGEGEPKGTWQETWKALEKLVKDGKLRSIGVSNFEVSDLEELNRIKTFPISVVQSWFDPFYQDANIRDWCKEHQVAYMGYSTLGEAWVREGLGYNPVLTDSGLRRIALNFDADVARIVLRWAIDKDAIVIPRSTSRNHIATNLQIHTIKLLQEDVEYIDSLGSVLDPDNIEQRLNPNNPEPANDIRLESSSSNNREKPFVFNSEVKKEVDPNEPIIYVSSDNHWIYAIHAETGDVMWRTETADETGSSCAFSATGDIIYCGADDTYVRALFTKNGSIAWKYKTGSAVTSSAHVTSDGTILIGSHDKYLYAFHPDGKLKWKFDTMGEVWSSPTSNKKGDIAYIAAQSYDKDNVFAINVASGQPIWKFKAYDGFVSSPKLTGDESVLVLADGSGYIYAIDSLTGEKIWDTQFEGTIESSAAISKASRVYTITHSGLLVVLDGRNGKKLWTHQGGTDAQFGTTSSPVFGPNDLVYAGFGDGTVIAFKQKDGTKVWSQKIGSSIFFSSPRLAKNGMLYIGSVDGPLIALNAETGNVIWKADTGGPIVGTALITKKFSLWYD